MVNQDELMMHTDPLKFDSDNLSVVGYLTEVVKDGGIDAEGMLHLRRLDVVAGPCEYFARYPRRRKPRWRRPAAAVGGQATMTCSSPTR